MTSETCSTRHATTNQTISINQPNNSCVCGRTQYISGRFNDCKLCRQSVVDRAAQPHESKQAHWNWSLGSTQHTSYTSISDTEWNSCCLTIKVITAKLAHMWLIRAIVLTMHRIHTQDWLIANRFWRIICVQSWVVCVCLYGCLWLRLTVPIEYILVYIYIYRRLQSTRTLQLAHKAYYMLFAYRHF